MSVEGGTEREFCSRVLGPYLMAKDVSVIAIDMRGRRIDQDLCEC